MDIDVRGILNEFMAGVGEVAEMDGAFVDKFMALDGGAGLAIEPKMRELVAVGLAVEKRCKYCICVHVNGAYKAGATRDEILAAAEIAIAMGGGPSLAYSATVLKAAVDEFEHDFD